MTRRGRRFAGLVTLLGLTFMLGEGFLAGTCTPQSMPIAAMGAASMAEVGDHASTSPSACDELHAGGRAHDGPGCPFSGFFSHGCSVGASVAAAAPSLVAFSPPVTVLSHVGPAVKPLLLVVALFHPPRA